MPEEKVSFRAKKETLCPICSASFNREELLSGSGRMNAGELSDELHREYYPTQKFGTIHPLIYPVSVCPQCWYAAYPVNFNDPEEQCIAVLKSGIDERKNIVKPVFDDLDFNRSRSLKEGTASYLLAALCYEHFPPEFTPTFYKALSFLRAGWLSQSLDKNHTGENYDLLAKIFLEKASFFYSETLRAQIMGRENVEEVYYHGPDLDNNYGLDGIYYLQGILQLKYGQKENIMKRIESLNEARSAVSRIVGLGKSSKAKPSAILELGRSLHKSLKTELDNLT